MQRLSPSDLPPDRPTVFYRVEGQSRIIRRIAPLRMLLTICLCFSASMLAWTIASRPAPDGPAVIYFGACVLPLAFYVLYYSSVRNLRTLKVFLLIATLYGGPLLAWNLSFYRGAVFAITWQVLPDRSLMTTIGDRSDWVGAMACERLMREPTLVREEMVMPVLEFRPALAERCLRGIGERRPELGHKLARNVAGRWYRAWMNSTILPVEHGCAAADVFVSVSAHRGDNGAAHLLHCALGAEHSAVGQCCAEALNRDFSAAQLPEVDPYRIPESLRNDLFFRVHERLGDIQGAPEIARATPALLDNPAWLLHWSVTLGCHLINTDARPDFMAAQMAVMTLQECNIDIQDTLYPSETTRLIRRTCGPVLGTEWFGQVDQYEWCSTVRRAAVLTAVEAASFGVKQAVVNLEFRRLAASIRVGFARRDRARYMEGPLGLGDFGGGLDPALHRSDFVSPRHRGWTQAGAGSADTRDPSQISFDAVTRGARDQSKASEKGGDAIRARQLEEIADVLESRRRESPATTKTMKDVFRRYDSR